MGLTFHSIDFILAARERGLKLGRTLTIGRQSLLLSPTQVEALLRRRHCWPPAIPADELRAAAGELNAYADPVLRAAGAESVTAMDISAFEGAGIVHDLNRPVPAELHGRFDTLIDGGSLEHIFNVPVALANYLRLVRVGGSVILYTIANNFFGHGLYQFSAELFFRVFSPENGFRIERVTLAEDDLVVGSLCGLKFPVNLPGRRFTVTDPAQVRDRVELVNGRQTVILVHAVKTADVEPFSQAPYQSDYATAWEENEAGQPRIKVTKARARVTSRFRPETIREVNLRWMPVAYRLLYALLPHGWFSGRHLGNSRFYRPEND